MFHVYTYLVGTARFKYTLYECYITYALQYLVVGHCMLANRRVGEDCHLQTVVRVAGNLTAYGTSVFL